MGCLITAFAMYGRLFDGFSHHLFLRHLHPNGTADDDRSSVHSDFRPGTEGWCLWAPFTSQQLHQVAIGLKVTLADKTN